MAHPWRSERLIYRQSEKDDEAFHQSLGADADAQAQLSTFIFVPGGGTKNATGAHEYLSEKSLMGAIICLPAPATSDAAPVTGEAAVASKPIPIGYIHLTPSDPRQAHHRHSMIGLILAEPHRSKGYGSEAIKWALRWGFMHAGLHRIEIAAYDFNDRAIALYRRLGFVDESVKREIYWVNGKFRDMTELSMLEHEWRKLYGGE